MDERIDAALQRFWPALAPPPDLKVSEWADAHRRLSSEASAEPGQWRTSRAPYQRGIMDALNEPGIEMVVIISSAQVGKTEIIGNTIGYFIHQDPAPMLVLQPTLEMGEAWSKDRLAPMLRDTPVLQGKVRDASARNSGNTLLHKTFAGGHVTIAGANSPAGLAMRPIRVLLGDEVDRYPVSAGTEGDPISLALKRTATFWNRKIVLTSTPTIAGASRIENAWQGSDRRRYWVPCPHCGTFQLLKWPQVVWPEGRPEDAYFACLGCGAAITNADKPKMLTAGEWRAENPGGKVAGFHLNELYSPWRTFGDVAESFLEAKRGGPEQLKVWINTSLGETWNPRDAEQLQAEGLMKRREEYEAPVPAGVAMLTAAVDTQDDRLEWLVLGWGLGGECWQIDHGAVFGNLALVDPWNSLHAVLTQTWRHAAGSQMPISASFVDSGGHYSKQVMQFTLAHRADHIFPLKGASRAQARPVQRGPKRSRLWMVDTVAIKDQLFARLRVATPGPGFIHFPMAADRIWFEQILAERPVVRRQFGLDRRVYEKVAPGARNEALDLFVYATAAIELLDPRDMGQRLERLQPLPAQPVEPVEQVEPPPPPPVPLRPRPRLGPLRPYAGWKPGGGSW